MSPESGGGAGLREVVGGEGGALGDVLLGRLAEDFFEVSRGEAVAGAYAADVLCGEGLAGMDFLDGEE